MDKKRKPRSYKCLDRFYKKAQKRAKKEKTTVANVVESSVIAYALESDLLEQPKD